MVLTMSRVSLKLPLLLVSLSTACCPPPQVTSFSVQPHLVCPGQTVVVQWDVRGRASLRAERGDAGSTKDWDEEEVLSHGKRTVVPALTTSFKITALDANAAVGGSFATQSVDVPTAAEDKDASSSCDPASRKCTGSFVLNSAAGPLRALRLSAPKRVRSGTEESARIHVVHQGVPDDTWVTASGPVPINVPADGTWTLETELGPDEALLPPPRLRIHIDFGCP